MTTVNSAKIRELMVAVSEAHGALGSAIYDLTRESDDSEILTKSSYCLTRLTAVVIAFTGAVKDINKLLEMIEGTEEKTDDVA